MKRRHSRYPKEVSVGTHSWCRSTPDERSLTDQYQDLGQKSTQFTRMPQTSFDLDYISCAIVWKKNNTYKDLYFSYKLKVLEKRSKNSFRVFYWNYGFSISNLVMQFIQFIFISYLIMYE